MVYQVYLFPMAIWPYANSFIGFPWLQNPSRLAAQSAPQRVSAGAVQSCYPRDVPGSRSEWNSPGWAPLGFWGGRALVGISHRIFTCHRIPGSQKTVKHFVWAFILALADVMFVSSRKEQVLPVDSPKWWINRWEIQEHIFSKAITTYSNQSTEVVLVTAQIRLSLRVEKMGKLYLI